ncbi:DUF4274 domain-containing protein [Aestuariibius insulae]|uniref:DUF4274 domain-containing protein n=1 Tax=Aestuariibius insulae TaxID=2058287 RepID=UPI00345EBC92
MAEPKIGVDAIPFDEDTTKYLASHSPELWNEVVYSLNPDSPLAEDILSWICNQPECDIATALTVFINFELEDITKVAISDTRGREEIAKYRSNKTWELTRIICENSERNFYQRSDFSPHRLEDQPASVLERLEKHRSEANVQKSDYLPIPRNLLKHNFPNRPPKPSGYFGDETGMYHISTLPPELQEMFKQS